MPLEGWKTLFEVGGVILLFLTFVFGAGALITSTKINERQAEKLRQFDVQLTDAQTKLGEQQERAANADARVAGLEKEAADSKAAMAKQQERAAVAEHSLLELQHRLEHRRITPAQHAGFVAMLQPYAGSHVALTKLGDSEAGTFADDIITVLNDAGWHVELSTIGVMAPPKYGLLSSVDGGSAAGQSLAKMLDELPTAHTQMSPHQQVIGKIFVGLRPPP